MQKRNYQKELDKLLESLPKDNKPTLLLHACCAPCSSYTLEYLSRYFRITVLFYNPNISPEDEFTKRAEELRRLISEMPLETPVGLIVAKYDSREFYDAVKGMEDLPEGGERCYVCYKLRLDKTALAAAENGFDYFATTLSISPYKNAQWLNDISEELAEIYSVKALPCDFKKRGGYKRSIELSAQYSLYRQDYCGCVYSRREREALKAKRSVSAE